MLIRGPLLPIWLAIAVTLPGIVLSLAHVELGAPLTALVAGAAIMAGAFLLVWACDAAQADVSQALALAAVALIAVLPEYAVDMYFTWQAGQSPDGDYAGYAIANMTGANRLIIGVAWVVIVGIFWLRTRRPVVLDEERRVEVGFLAAASLYALLIPIKGSLAWHDGIVLIALYAWYVVLAAKRPQIHSDAGGPGEYLAGLPAVPRRVSTVLLFLFAAGAVIANAERFCEGLVATGTALGINEFLLVQWLAPIASEAPEFVVAIMFALRGKAGLALGSLLSAKLNQWTLLVGMIPGVFAVSSGSLALPIPMGDFQMQEILLTAAQSLLAVVMLATLRLSLGQALLLFALFAGQLVASGVTGGARGEHVAGLHGEPMHAPFSFLYFLLALALVVARPRRLLGLWPWHIQGPPRPVSEPCSTCGDAVDALLAPVPVTRRDPYQDPGEDV